MHPLFRLIATQPQLLAHHVAAYADLLADEIGHASTVWKRKAMLNVAALCCLAMTAVLAGVALMLWAVIPATQLHAGWALIAVPLLPSAVAVSCLWAARKQPAGRAFDKIGEQVQADLAMLRDVSVP